MRFIADSDELYRDAHSLPGPAHGAFHDVGDTEIAANLLDALRGRFELHRRGSGDHPEMLWAQAGQLGDHLLGQPVAEIVVSIPRSEVLEWQDPEHGSFYPIYRRIESGSLHVGRETVTALRQGLNEILPVRSRSQSLAQHGNVRAKASFLNDGAGPHFPQKMLPREHTACGLHQDDQEFGRLGRQGPAVALEKQPPGWTAGAIRAELVLATGGHRRESGELHQKNSRCFQG